MAALEEELGASERALAREKETCKFLRSQLRKGATADLERRKSVDSLPAGALAAVPAAAAAVPAGSEEKVKALERALRLTTDEARDHADMVATLEARLRQTTAALDELQTLSVRTLELDGHLTSTSVKKFFDEIVTVVIKGVILHDRAGTATYCEAHTSDHAMVDSPTYSVFYGLGEEQTGDVEGE